MNHEDFLKMMDDHPELAELDRPPMLDDLAPSEQFVKHEEVELEPPAFDEINQPYKRKTDKKPRSDRDDGAKQAIVELVQTDDFYLFTDSLDEVLATVQVNGHAETWPVRSRGFQKLVSGRIYDATKKAPSPNAFRDALPTIEAIANKEGNLHNARLRVGMTRSAEGSEIDLGDGEWKAVRLTTHGWHVVERPAVRFQRSHATKALPIPKEPTEEHPGDLKPFLNIKNPGDHNLLRAWLLQAMRPGPTEYPILVLTGGAGSAKTTAARVLRALLDPSEPELQGTIPDTRNLIVAAKSSHLLILDNQSGISPSLSDALCGLVTGTGHREREMNTNFGEVSFSGSRPMILTAIDDVVTRPDLVDRAIFIELKRLTPAETMDPDDFWASFYAERPYIFHSLLDDYCAGLKALPTVQMTERPRMAAFAKFAVACLGPDLATIYEQNRRGVGDSVALENSPVWDAWITHAKGEGEHTPAEWLDICLGSYRDDFGNLKGVPKDFPTTPSHFSAAMKSIQPQIERMGHQIEWKRSKSKRTIRWTPAPASP